MVKGGEESVARSVKRGANSVAFRFVRHKTEAGCEDGTICETRPCAERERHNGANSERVSLKTDGIQV